MPDINKQCWSVIGSLGCDDGEAMAPAAVERLSKMGLVEIGDDDRPRLTADGEAAYVVLESGDGEVPGLE